ncbi:hypothetical protein [Allokutzneria albata]|uniref:Transcriptional regulator, AbiEi antitoxin, Type IV TA system n=1 Tax=Allokutzneria albata TaxID=211114 RepID=A0A1H0B9Z1_ALLAB|nr:hypothetical protein [Allokutzneria albata]SDN42447.1 Transcriptional regulator, AbiEi antitoxin, Type IV TA system [Allokutzneria albata]
MPNRPDPWHWAYSHRSVLNALGENRLRNALRYGRLVQPWRGVIVPRERMGDPKTMAAAALIAIGSGAVLSGFTAAAMYGCMAADTRRVCVTVPHARLPRSRPGLLVRHAAFGPEDVVELDELPVLAPELVFTELLCTGPRHTALACADQLMRSLPEDLRPAFREQLRGRLGKRGDRRGVTGALAMVDLITERARTAEESALRLLVVDNGFPLPEVQYEIPDLDGCVPLAWPELRIALGYREPGRHPPEAARELSRDRALTDLGWVGVWAGPADLQTPTALVARLRAAFRRRGWAQVGPRPAQGRVRRSLT